VISDITETQKAQVREKLMAALKELGHTGSAQARIREAMIILGM
jgi:hypothetical protein